MTEPASAGERISLDIHAELRREQASWRERYPGEVTAGFRIERLQARLRQAEFVAAALDTQRRAAEDALERLRLRDDLLEVLEREPDALDHMRTQLARVRGQRDRAAAQVGRIRQQLDDALQRDALGLPPAGGAFGDLGGEG